MDIFGYYFVLNIIIIIFISLTIVNLSVRLYHSGPCNVVALFDNSDVAVKFLRLRWEC